VLSVTFDANVYVSALNFGGTPLRLLNLARTRAVRLDVSEAILDELADVLRVKFAWREPDIEKVIAQIRALANHVAPAKKVKVVHRDSDDDAILACAATALSDYLVTGDKDLLEVASYGVTQIIKPAEFLALASGH
jgi:uncharacterized protein